MSAMAVTFVLYPCIAAGIVAAMLTDWRLAAAVLCGALGALFLGASLPGTIALVSAPFALGAALAALILLWTLRRGTPDIWGRLLVAVPFTFAVTFLRLVTFSPGAS